MPPRESPLVIQCWEETNSQIPSASYLFARLMQHLVIDYSRFSAARTRDGIDEKVCVPNLHMHTFDICSMTINLRFGGSSDWHPDCGNALCQLTETHR
jgi:hypothetical protein